MGKLLQDVRYGLRMFAKSPAFTAIAILTLALGIGANTAIFSLIDAVMLRSLPVDKPSDLVLLKWSARNSPRIRGYMSSGDCPTDMRFGAANPSGCSFSEPMFHELAKANQFAGLAAFANSGPLSLTGGDGPATTVSGQLVSGDFFRTLGVKAAAGRLFEAGDDSLTAAPVAILNYGYWQSAFGGSRAAIGRTIQLNAVPFTIVGVAEQRFTGLTPGSDYDVWMPLSVGGRINDPRMWDNRDANVSFWWLTVVGRMKPGASLAQVQAAVSGVFTNEMLHGSVPLFEEGGRAFRPGGRGPGGGGGGRQMTMVMGGGPPPPAPGAGPGPTPRMMHAPPPSGARGPLVFNGPPSGARGPLVLNGPQPGMPSGNTKFQKPVQVQPTPPATSNQQGQPPAENTQTATLSKPDDAPILTLVNAQTGLTGSRRRFANPLYVLMCAVGIILLIACSNVAGLMLARATARNREIAIRLALGAGRARIVRQLLTESVMLAAIGGALGVAFAEWGSHVIVSFVSSNQSRPLTFATGIDMRVLGFTVAISLLTGILFGLAPAFRGARVDLTPALKEGSGMSAALGHGGGKWFSFGNALVVVQVALAIVVLVGAGLMVRTLQNLRNIDPGFDSRNLVIFGINPSLAGYKDAEIDSFYRDLQGRLAATPGVRSASYSMLPLLSGNLMITDFHWPGTPEDRPSESDVLQVGPDFFSTMQIPFVAGRNFNSSDYAIAAADRADQASSVARPVVVDQAFVAKFLGKENPLGKRFGQEAHSADEPSGSPGYEIVGVVRDTKYNDLRREITPTMFSPQSGNGASFEVRTAGDPQALVPAIRHVVADMNSNLPLRDVTTESHQIDRLLFEERLITRLSSFFGVLALVLACIGLYGLLSYEVTRRTREIGVRMALGAQVEDVLRLVVKQGLVLALIGAIVGIGVALSVTRYLASMLYNVKANDPATIITVAILLGLVAFAACFIPARRATRVDPIIALRYE